MIMCAEAQGGPRCGSEAELDPLGGGTPGAGARAAVLSGPKPGTAAWAGGSPGAERGRLGRVASARAVGGAAGPESLDDRECGLRGRLGDRDERPSTSCRIRANPRAIPSPRMRMRWQEGRCRPLGMGDTPPERGGQRSLVTLGTRSPGAACHSACTRACARRGRLAYAEHCLNLL